MSQIQVDNIYNKEATGSPSFPLGANVTGVITATSFSGSGANLTGIDATALKDGSGNVKIQANSDGAVVTGVITATTGSFTGNVSVGGTLTYEDVTNVDAVGVITARSGIDITGASAGVNGSSNLILKTGGTEKLRIESSGATRLKNEYLRFQAANQTVSDFSQKVGLKWTYETDIEIAKIEISRPSWSGGPSDMLFHTRNTSGTVSERLRIGKDGQIGLSGANYGTSGQVLTSQGASAAPQWASVAGAVELVQSINQTSGSTYLEVTGITDTCVKHVIELNDITYGATRAANQGQIRAQVYLAGSYNNWLTSNSEYDSRTVWQEWNTGVSQAWGNSLNYFRITADTDGWITAGDLTIFNNGYGTGSGSANDKLMVGSMMLSNNGHIDGYFRMDAYYARQNPITKIRFFDGNGRNIWGRADLYRYNR